MRIVVHSAVRSAHTLIRHVAAHVKLSSALNAAQISVTAAADARWDQELFQRSRSRVPRVSPVALFVAEVVPDLVHDGGARQDVGFVLLLVVTLHHHDEPVH